MAGKTAQDFLAVVEKSTLDAGECECQQCQNYAADMHWLVKQLKKAQHRIAELERKKK